MNWKIIHPSKIKITPFFEKKLRAGFKNYRQSWGAVNPVSNLVFLKIWADLINKNEAEVYWKKYKTKSQGQPERFKHLEAIRHGAIGIGILCESTNRKTSPRKVKRSASPRRVKSFDDVNLLLLGKLSDDKECIYARIIKKIPISELKTFRSIHNGKQNSVIDDIPVAPTGSKIPNKILAAGFQYERDEKVRRFVIRQAKGACEYCSEVGFLLPDGSHYLEAHHIIALAKQGPDTVNNVIALCPSDHREAHYGKKSSVMEREMIKIIKNRKTPR